MLRRNHVIGHPRHHKFLKGTQSRWTNKEKLNEECDHFLSMEMLILTKVSNNTRMDYSKI
jgi:hypothetical protein